MVGVMASLGWRWRVVRHSYVAHLVPKVAGKGSRTACNALSVPLEEELTLTIGLFGTAPLCPRCVRAER